jgi:TolB-like protein/DNA-binding winged helix-turn-helix (wHTH) protein/Flp pilus assembly protein TadD
MLAVNNHERIHLFNEFTLDLARGCVTRSGQEIHLRPQTYEVLKCLVEDRGHLISKDKLIEEVWKGRAVTDGSLGKCIEELREALGPEAKQFIRNVRGRGYIFDTGSEDGERAQAITAQSEQIDVVRVTVEDHEEIPDVVVPKALPRAIAAPRPVNKLKIAAMAAGTLVVVVGLFVAYRFLVSSASNSAPITSIAVLPFKNESGNPDAEYLSDGISESLINSLARMPQLKVIARNSSFQYKGKDLNPQEVSRALGVQAILIGRIAQHGDSLVVSVELMDARDKTQVWGERYTRRAADIQVVEEEITRTVSEKLRLRLSGTQQQQLARHATQNSQAYQFYLNGLFHLRKGQTEDMRKALEYFNQAVTLDPNFALAWAAVSRANHFFAGNSLLDTKEPLARAKAATQKALELDETLAEAHVELAFVKRHEWDWAGAEREYKRAVELNPSLVDAHLRYSDYLSLMGRHEEALAEIKRAQEIDPLRVSLKIREAWTLHLARRSDEAIALHQSVKTEPGRGQLGLGFMYEAKGMYERAINEFQNAIRIDGESTGALCYLGSALALSGRKKEALAILDKLKTTKEYVSPTELAVLYITLGDKESGLAMLEKAYAAHDIQLQTLIVDWHFDSVRSDPRFQDLLRRVGLPS